MIKNLLGSSLLRSSGLYTLTNIINAAIPFFMLPVLTRYLSPVDYGIVTIFTVLIGFLNPFIGINMHGAITRQYYDRDSIDMPKYISNGIFILIFNVIFITSIVGLLSGQIYKLTTFPINWLWSVVLVAAFQVIVQITLVIWQVQVKPLSYGAFQISQTLLNLGLSLWFVVQLNFSWQGRISAQIIAISLFGCIGLFILWKNGWIKLKFDKSYIKSHLSYGIPLIPHTIGSITINLVDRLFITKMVGLEATGIYTVGYQIGMIIGILQDSFNKAWVPWLFKQLKENNEKTKINIVKLTYFYFIVIIVVALILSSIAPWLLSFFVGEEFTNASKYVFWVAIGYAFNGMYKMVTNYIFYVKKTYILAWITFFTAVINIILNYLLISNNGAVGAAQATTVAYFISFVFTWILSSKVYKMPWKLK
jgi:O-antigen/teichoic acid export membrane protein